MLRSAFLMANDGTGAGGGIFDLTDCLTETGSVQWEVDKQLTKMSPGSITFRVADPEENLWRWLEAQVLSRSGALPPWVFLDVFSEERALGDGENFLEVGCSRRFLGILPLSQCSRLKAERAPSLDALDWSTMLANIFLDWERPWPKAAKEIERAETMTCRINARRIKRLFGTEFAMDDAFFMDTPDFKNKLHTLRGNGMWVEPGDIVWISCNHHLDNPFSNECYRVLKTTANNSEAFVGGLLGKVKAAYERSAPHPSEVTVVRGGSGFEAVSAYTVASDPESDVIEEMESGKINLFQMAAKLKELENSETANHRLPLNTIDGLVMGDVLELLHPTDKKTFTVQQLNALDNSAICKEEVDIKKGSLVYLSEESRRYLVFEDVRALISRACIFSDAEGGAFDVDMSKFFPAILPFPAFTWLPMRPFNGQDVMPVSGIEPAYSGGKSGIKVFSGCDRAYFGNPSDGWAATEDIESMADWTGQQVYPPPCLMPQNGQQVSFVDGQGGGGIMDLDPSQELNILPLEGGRWVWKKFGKSRAGRYVWKENASGPENPTGFFVFDYKLMRRIVWKGRDMSVQHWDGYAWGPAAASQWPDEAPISVCVCVGSPGFIVAATDTYIAIGKPGGNYFTARLPESVAKASTKRLMTTPWGIYLVTETSYSRIVPTVLGNYDIVRDIAITTAEITNSSDAELYVNTFVGVNKDTVAVFGKFTEYSPFVLDEYATETHLLLLKAFPAPAEPGEGLPTDHPSVIATDKIIEGKPISIGCLRDPSASNRVVGHLGGQLFQIAAQMPWTVEKFAADELSAAELIEHVCQLHLATAYPDTEGTLHIVSRNLSEIPRHLDLPCSIIDTDETLNWPDHATYVCVSGANDDAVGDYYGAEGGNTLEISGHPMIYSATMAKAVAAAYGQFFGEPRKYREMNLAWLDESEPPWMALGHLPATVSINSEGSNWLVTAIGHHDRSGKATLKMLESKQPPYGQDYGMGNL